MISRRQALVLGAGATLVGAAPLARADERVVLAQVLDVLYAGAGPRPPSELGAVEAALAYLQALPWARRQQLRGLLRAWEGLPLPRTGQRWSRLDPGARLAWLDSLATSDRAAERLIVHAVRQIGAIAVYSRPQTWAGIGYEGPP